jgi:hypothetical protein
VNAAKRRRTAWADRACSTDLPKGLSINSTTELISGTVDYQAAENFGGSYPVTVIVADDHGASTTQTFTWTIIDTRCPSGAAEGGGAGTPEAAAVAVRKTLAAGRCRC